MEAARPRAPKTVKLIRMLTEPRRFTDLQQALKMSSRSLTDSLRKLMNEGLVQKLPDGRYVLTEEGCRVAEEFEVFELVREVLRSHGAREVKASLNLLLRLDRAPRIIALKKLLMGLLAARTIFRVHASARWIEEAQYEEDSAASETSISQLARAMLAADAQRRAVEALPEVNHYIRLLEDHLKELGSNPYEEDAQLAKMREDNAKLLYKLLTLKFRRYIESLQEAQLKDLLNYIGICLNITAKMSLDALSLEERKLAMNAAKYIELARELHIELYRELL